MCCITALFFLLSWTATDLSVSGVVSDINGSPILGARVVLEHTVEGRSWGTTTAEDGGFEFQRLALGSYLIRVTSDGYFELETTLRLEAGKMIELTLAPIEILRESVEVIARPDPINPDAVSVQHTVNDEVIQNLPYTGRRNFVNALALMPGVVRDSYDRIHIHGSRPDQIRYQLDGINVTDPSTGTLSSNIPLDAIESVDIDLMGYSAEFGKGSGGIVRVQSHFIGDRMRWNFTDFVPGVNFQRKTIGEFSPRLLASGPIVQRKLWFMYSGSLRYVQNFNEDLPEGENRQNQTLADQLVKLQWSSRDAQVLTLSLLHNSEYYGNIGMGRYRPIETTTNVLRRGTTASVSNRSVVRNVLFESAAQWTRRTGSELAKGPEPLQVRPAGWIGNFYEDRRGRDHRLRFAQTAAWQREWRGIIHRFKTGGELDHVSSNLAFDRRGFQVYDERDALISLVSFAGPDAAEVHNREYGFFFQNRMELNASFQLELGVRLDREAVIGRNNAAPRLAFSFLPGGNERSKISGGAGLFYDNVPLRYIQLPRMQRLVNTPIGGDGRPAEAAPPTAVLRDPSLGNPFGLHWNVAWEHVWGSRWVTRAAFVRKREHRQVRLAALPNANGLDLAVNNSGKSRYDAIEVSLDRPIRTDLRILASYIYSRARGRPSLSPDFPDPEVERITEAPLDWDTPHRFVSWGYFPFFLGMNASYSIEARSGFPFTPINRLNRFAGEYNGSRLPAHFVTNFSLEKELPFLFNRRIAVRGGVLNLFNRFNPRFVDTNVHSPTFMEFSDSSSRHFVGRVRLIKN